DTATSVAVGPGGAIYVAGQTTRAGSRDLMVLRFSPAGGLVWKRFIGGTAGPDQASALALDGSGNVLVAGWVTWRGRGTNVALAKYTPAGDKLWLRTWDGATHRTDKATDLAVDGAGNAVLVGSTALARNSQTAGLLLKYSASGDLRWARRQGGTGGDALASVALAANGAVFAGGRTRLAKTGVGALVVKYTAAGASVWKWVATGKGDGRDAIADIAVAGAGWVHAAGSTVDLGTHSDGLVMSAGPNGLSRSAKAYDGGSYLTDAFRTVACGAAGDVFVGGFITSATGVTSAVVAQYSRDLSQRPWLTTFKGTVPGSQNRAVDLALAPGGVFVAGTVVDTVTGPDLALAKLRR
ncbi:MAG: hypothetical protein ACXVP1_06805, partial [Thermoleophilia bacterium]